jgi:hypothetical protein
MAGRPAFQGGFLGSTKRIWGLPPPRIRWRQSSSDRGDGRSQLLELSTRRPSAVPSLELRTGTRTKVLPSWASAKPRTTI